MNFHVTILKTCKFFKQRFLKTNNIFTYPHWNRFAKSSCIHAAHQQSSRFYNSKSSAPHCYCISSAENPSITKLYPSSSATHDSKAWKQNYFFSASPSCYITESGDPAECLYFLTRIINDSRSMIPQEQDLATEIISENILTKAITQS